MAFGLLLASCASPATSPIPWKALDGKGLAARRVPKAEPGLEGRLLPGQGFRLELSEARTLPAGVSLELDLRQGPHTPPEASLAVEVGLYAAGKSKAPFATHSATLRSARTRLVLPLPRGVKLAALELRAAPGNGEGASTGDGPAFELIGISEVPAWSGILPAMGSVRLSAGASAWRQAGVDHARIETPQVAGSGPSVRTGLLVEYGPGGGGKRLEILADGKTCLSMRLHPAGLRTNLPLDLVPAGARQLELVLPGGVAFRAFTAGAVDTLDAELADFGTILRAPLPADGRDYDLYRWDLLPEVLVFDFRDLAVQDGYLKRLAFFVEKEGFRGRLAADEEIAGLHGWNAHDYRASDLAAFFSLAKKEAFPLGPREVALRDLLAERGIIVEDGGAYREGRGAIISISRESEAWLRSLFLTHESTHAIFFTDAAYRGFVTETWKAMTKEEKWFWKLFFGWKTYDTGDDYLMANEYQAYLLQQGLKQTEAYFTKNAPAQITENHKELVPRIEEYMKEYAPSFEARARALDTWLDAKYGFKAGGGASW